MDKKVNIEKKERLNQGEMEEVLSHINIKQYEKYKKKAYKEQLKREKREAKLDKKRMRNERIKAFLVKLMNITWKYYKIGKEKTLESIRLQLIFSIFVCFIVYSIVFGISKTVTTKLDIVQEISYDYSIDSIERRARSFANYSGFQELGMLDYSAIHSRADSNIHYDEIVHIVNMEGKLLYSNNKEFQGDINLVEVINSSVNKYDKRSLKTFMVPIEFTDGTGLLIYKDVPVATTISVSRGTFGLFLARVIGLFVAFICFLYMTRRKVLYLEKVNKSIESISRGNFASVPVEGKDEISKLAIAVNTMSSNVDEMINKIRLTENNKNELITNVSHDLRTPLTSINGYLRLIKDGKYNSDEELNEYIDIVFKKSEQLNNQISDLYDFTRFSSNEIKVDKKDIDYITLLTQTLDDFTPVFEEERLQIKQNLLLNSKIKKLDPNLIHRALNNLIGNAIKYSQSDSDIIVECSQVGKLVRTKVSNQAKDIESIEFDRLFDRFYRGDKSRNQEVNGTGLGMAITKQIIRLHEGEIRVYREDDRFVVEFDI